jgi:predicted enzyme related to lactoylglutathione lyase
MKMKRNVVNWFEVPVLDMDRAIRFYETVFGFKMEKMQMGNQLLAWFPAVEEDGPGTGGALVLEPGNMRPSPDGVLVYFTAPSGNVEFELTRVESAGGVVLIPKTLISKEYGYYGMLLDSEGNRIGIHSRI